MNELSLAQVLIVDLSVLSSDDCFTVKVVQVNPSDVDLSSICVEEPLLVSLLYNDKYTLIRLSSLILRVSIIDPSAAI